MALCDRLHRVAARECGVERGGLAWLAFHPHATAVRLDEPLRDVESEAEARRPSLARRSRAAEAGEKSRQLLGRDPSSLVHDRYLDFVSALPRLNGHVAVSVAVFDRVADQIAEDLLEAADVDEDRRGHAAAVDDEMILRRKV